jgi:hypothetical protein
VTVYAGRPAGVDAAMQAPAVWSGPSAPRPRAQADDAVWFDFFLAVPYGQPTARCRRAAGGRCR